MVHYIYCYMFYVYDVTHDYREFYSLLQYIRPPLVGKGKAEDNRLVHLIAQALVQNKEALKEVVALLPDVTEPEVCPDGTEAGPSNTKSCRMEQGNNSVLSESSHTSDNDIDNMSVSDHSVQLSTSSEHEKVGLGTFSSVHPVIT